MHPRRHQTPASIRLGRRRRRLLQEAGAATSHNFYVYHLCLVVCAYVYFSWCVSFVYVYVCLVYFVSFRAATSRNFYVVRSLTQLHQHEHHTRFWLHTNDMYNNHTSSSNSAKPTNRNQITRSADVVGRLPLRETRFSQPTQCQQAENKGGGNFLRRHLHYSTTNKQTSKQTSKQTNTQRTANSTCVLHSQHPTRALRAFAIDSALGFSPRQEIHRAVRSNMYTCLISNWVHF